MQQNSPMNNEFILLYQSLLIPAEKRGNNIFNSKLLLQFTNNNKNHAHE